MAVDITLMFHEKKANSYL